jgi:hypothetical protein
MPVMTAAVAHVAKANGWAIKDTFVWVDFSSSV